MMPAGKYYIGDLCYVMHGEWDEFCGITIDGNCVRDGEFKLKDGRRFATYCTMYGDGEYPASDGSRLGVDAGLIGCIRVEDIDLTDPNNDVTLGTVVEFEHDFRTGSRGGIIHFGHIEVNTGFSDIDEYEYDEDYWAHRFD
jgi:hypothetical protein